MVLLGTLMADEALALKVIRHYVWSGLYDTDEIAELVDESMAEPGQLDPNWLRAEIDKAVRKKRNEDERWPATTDCDRLDEVFEALEDQGIIALQDAGYTQDNGLDDVTEIYHEAGGEESDIVGYCFFHGQDLERVMRSGKLFLTYGDILGDDDKGTEIGQRIKRAFEEAGFTIEWNGSIKSRLLVKDFCWQRRSPEEGD
jgi:hypothetical protein